MPTLGLCVIAKNAAPTLPACLSSVQGLVHEMVVIDTGSSDATAALAQRAGARVASFAWANDFAAARNRALETISTDWVLVLDADEELDGAAAHWIRKELECPRFEAYVTPVRNYLQPWEEPLVDAVPLPPEQRHPHAPAATKFIHSEVCRLYRRDPAIYYVGHVHEQVEYRLMELGRPIGRAGFFIHHFGWYRIDAAGWQVKRQMYHDLLAAKLAQRPDDPQVLLQYGDAVQSWFGQVRKGLDCFLRAAAIRPEQRGIWLHIATALLQLGEHEAALIAIGRIPANEGAAGRRAQLLGETLGALGRLQEARLAYGEALAHHPDYLGVQVKLALLEMETGERAQGEARMCAAIERAERDLECHPTPPGYLRVAEMHAQLRQWQDVLRLTRAGLLLSPGGALKLEELRMRAAVAAGLDAEAADAAAQIVFLNPSPRAVLRHAAILHHGGDRLAAQAVLCEGRRMFEDSADLARAASELACMAGGAEGVLLSATARPPICPAQEERPPG